MCCGSGSQGGTGLCERGIRQPAVEQMECVLCGDENVWDPATLSRSSSHTPSLPHQPVISYIFCKKCEFFFFGSPGNLLFPTVP